MHKKEVDAQSDDASMGDNSQDSVSDTSSDSSESPSTGDQTYNCEYCDEVFTEGAALGRHMGSKHRKAIKERREQKKELERTGLDVIAKITGGMSEEEYIAQHGEDGFYKLKSAWLEKFLSKSMISPKTVDYIMSYYNLNVAYQQDLNELRGLLSAAGVNERQSNIIMKAVMAWEEKAQEALFMSQESGSRGYYGASRGGRSFLGRGGQDSYYGNRGQSGYGTGGESRMMPGGRSGYRTMPGMGGDDRPMTMGDAYEMFSRMMDDKRKADKLENLERQIRDMPDKILDAVNESFGQGGRRGHGRDGEQEEEPMCDYEVPLMDPTTRKPMLDDDGKIIMMRRRVPVSKMPTWDDVQSQPQDMRSIIREELQQQTGGSKSDPQIKELKEMLKKNEEKFEAIRDQMSKTQIDAANARIDDLHKALESVSSNAGEWQSDGYHLMAKAIDNLGKHLERREPLSKWVPKVLLGQEQKLTPEGDRNQFVEIASNSELPVDDRTSQESS